MVRLNKYLAQCGIAARRKCDELILAGEVSVNGVTQQNLGAKVNEKRDKVTFREQLVSPKENRTYILFNKPKGVVTTVSDERGRKSVLDIVRVKNRVFPVGRLDRDSSGLLLLTDDGELAYRLTHPRYRIPKTYRVHLNAELVERDRKVLQSGIQLEEGQTSPCNIEFPFVDTSAVVLMTIQQGWKRQIRRMFSELGYDVNKLHRTNIAELGLNKLTSGKWRKLTDKEVKYLKKIVNGN